MRPYGCTECRGVHERLANTLVFIVAGAIIAGRIYKSSKDDGASIQSKDWAYAFLLWVYLTVSQTHSHAVISQIRTRCDDFAKIGTIPSACPNFIWKPQELSACRRSWSSIWTSHSLGLYQLNISQHWRVCLQRCELPTFIKILGTEPFSWDSWWLLRRALNSQNDTWRLMQVIRIVTFIILVPILNSRGYTLNWKECAVLSWSGVRGAVGLALGLQIYHDDEIHSELFRVKQGFHIGCVTVLTILVQGTSMRPFMKVSSWRCCNIAWKRIWSMQWLSLFEI